ACFFFSSRRRHTRFSRDWSSDVCSSDLTAEQIEVCAEERVPIVSFHWGHPPADRLKRLHEAGVAVWEQVGSAAAAEQAVAGGARSEERRVGKECRGRGAP